MKSFITTNVSFRIVGALSLPKNLLLSSCKTNDGSERNLQLVLSLSMEAGCQFCLQLKRVLRTVSSSLSVPEMITFYLLSLSSNGGLNQNRQSKQGVNGLVLSVLYSFSFFEKF